MKGIRVLLALGAGFLFAPLAEWSSSARADSITYWVAADTSAWSGQTGFVEFQFSPSPGGSPPTTATVFGFSATGGSLGSMTANPFFTPNPMGSIAGAPPYPLPVTLNNTDIVNDIVYDMTYGSNMGFLVTLSGPNVGIPGPGASAFSLFLWGVDPFGDPTLLPGGEDPAGEHLKISTCPNCPTYAADFIQFGTAIPEPTSLALFLTVLAGLAGFRLQKWLVAS
jgi:hypothetical protein